MNCRENWLYANDYQKQAMEICKIPYDTDKEMLIHAVFAMCSEAGEVASILQKEYQGHEFNRDHIKKELGDVLWCVAEACTALDFDIEDVMKTNIEKLHNRYPNGFEVYKSLHRKEGDI